MDNNLNFINPIEVRIKVKRSCYDEDKGLFYVRFKGSKMLIPGREFVFHLINPIDIGSLWSILLDVREVDEFSIKGNTSALDNTMNF